MYEARYYGIVSAYTILHVQAGFIHVVCLGISNKSVAVLPSMPIGKYVPGNFFPFTLLCT